MRLGGPVFVDPVTPESWITALKQNGYGAAYCPVQTGASREEIRAYAKAARDAGIIISEVGAWSNVLDMDQTRRRQAIEYTKQQLALADEIGALCCVNVTGSRMIMVGVPNPAGSSNPMDLIMPPVDLMPETFEMIVDTVRDIIDSVKPQRACYAIEPMPWRLPDSPDSYNDLIDAIDRPCMGVLLDVVNMITSPRLYFHNAAFIRECFQKLGPKIASVHAKDIRLGSELTVHLREARPGLGALDYRAFLREMNRLPADTPMMLEHLSSEEEYQAAAKYLREIGKELEIAL